MDIASLCPLPVGVLAWRSPRPALTVIVKMTLALGDAEPSLKDPQDGLSLDRPSPIGAPHELLYASDFVPKKARCDVLLAGHARSPAPTRKIPVRFDVGDLERCFFALAAEPSVQIPLSSTYLRAGESASSGDVRVGPMGALSPARSKLLERASVGPSGALLAPLPADFDFGAFNAAPPEQQIVDLPSGAVIELDALLAGQPHRTIQLPSERPRVYARHRGARGRSLLEVPLRCDTLFIDTDRALCSLVWRGVIELARDGDEPPDLAVSLAAFGLAERVSDLERRLEGASRVRAAEVSDFQAPVLIEDETTSSMGPEPAPKTSPMRGLVGSLGATQPGGLGRASVNHEEIKRLREIPVRQPAPAIVPADDETEELAAEELLEVDVEEVEPEVADDPTPFPVMPPRAFKRSKFESEESTQTNLQVPQRAALPFDRPSPIPAGPESAEVRPSYPDLPFAVAVPSVAAAPPSEVSPPLDPPEALPFKKKRRMTLIDPPARLDDVPSGLPFVKAPDDAAREVSPAPAAPPASPVLPFVSVAVPVAREVVSAPEAPPAVPVLPFVKAAPEAAREVVPGAEALPAPVLPFLKVPVDAPRDEAPAKEAPSPVPVLPFLKAPAEAPRVVPPPAEVLSALPFVKPAAPAPSNPVATPPDVPSALPFTRPAARPPSDAPPPPVWVPSALPFVQSAPAAPAPSAVSPFLPPIDSAPSPAVAPLEAGETQAQRPLLPLETYAAIQVDLWEEGSALEDVLARHGMDEITWRDNEQRRADALAAEAKRGRSDIAIALAEALEAAAARRSLPENDPKNLSLDDYVAIRVLIEDAPDPEPVLARKNLSEAQWQKLDRQWRKRARGNASVAKEIRTKLAELRKAVDAPPPPEAKPSPKRRKSRSRASAS